MKLIYTLETKFFFFFSFLFFFSLPSFVSSLRSVYILPACSSLLPFCPLSFLSLSPDDAAGRLRSRSLRKFRVLIIPPCFLCPLARARHASLEMCEKRTTSARRERERAFFKTLSYHKNRWKNRVFTEKDQKKRKKDLIARKREKPRKIRVNFYNISKKNI